MSLTFDESIANMLEIGNIPITERPPMDVPCIQLVSTQINNGDTISIVVLRSPHLIRLDTIEKLFRITLVYTSRAFLGVPRRRYDDVNGSLDASPPDSASARAISRSARLSFVIALSPSRCIKALVSKWNILRLPAVAYFRLAYLRAQSDRRGRPWNHRCGGRETWGWHVCQRGFHYPDGLSCGRASGSSWRCFCAFQISPVFW